jgi:hypothetical protein
MSLASVFVLLGFLGFFLVVVPVGIWLFAKFFPKRDSSVFGFPEPTVSDGDTAGPRILRTPGTANDDR